MSFIARPDLVRCVAEGLDHPECLSFGPDGLLYAGGEAGQIYRIHPDTGEVREVARTDGFHLGLALDATGNVYVCDPKTHQVRCVTPDGRAHTLTRGTSDRPMDAPNSCVFDRQGNLYVSDSGDYWSQEGTGCIFVVRPSGTTELFHPGPLRFPNGLAIDPSHQFLYVVESTVPRIARMPLGKSRPSPHLEAVVEMEACVPDGLAFDAAGRLYIGCYKPDVIYCLDCGGHLTAVVDDPTGELLSRPTNLAIRDGMLYIANLGGWHIGAMRIDAEPGPIHYPRIRSHAS